MLELLKVSTQNTYSCGNGALENISGMLPYVTSTIYLIIEIAVPVLLILYGMFDLGKAVIAQKEDEIKKGQATFFKRLIAAILVFFVLMIVKLVIGFVSENDPRITGCVSCFIEGKVDDGACSAGSGSSNTTIPKEG
jgi:hypothetical protein